MAKRSKETQSLEDIELVPDAWPRFERFIKTIVKAGPQHKAPTKKKSRRKKPKDAK